MAIYTSVAVHILVSGGLHDERCLSRERRHKDGTIGGGRGDESRWWCLSLCSASKLQPNYKVANNAELTILLDTNDWEYEDAAAGSGRMSIITTSRCSSQRAS
jgi:hypothetical protein